MKRVCRHKKATIDESLIKESDSRPIDETLINR